MIAPSLALSLSLSLSLSSLLLISLARVVIEPLGRIKVGESNVLGC